MRNCRIRRSDGDPRHHGESSTRRRRRSSTPRQRRRSSTPRHHDQDRRSRSRRTRHPSPGRQRRRSPSPSRGRRRLSSPSRGRIRRSPSDAHYRWRSASGESGSRGARRRSPSRRGAAQRSPSLLRRMDHFLQTQGPRGESPSPPPPAALSPALSPGLQDVLADVVHSADAAPLGHRRSPSPESPAPSPSTATEPALEAAVEAAAEVAVQAAARVAAVVAVPPLALGTRPSPCPAAQVIGAYSPQHAHWTAAAPATRPKVGAFAGLPRPPEVPAGAVPQRAKPLAPMSKAAFLKVAQQRPRKAAPPCRRSRAEAAPGLVAEPPAQRPGCRRRHSASSRHADIALHKHETGLKDRLYVRQGRALGIVVLESSESGLCVR